METFTRFAKEVMRTKMNKEIVKQFNYKGRLCVIIKIDMLKDLPSNLKGTFSFANMYHNGYVELTPEEFEKAKGDYNAFDISAEEPTFIGELEGVPRGLVFLGFDTAHLMDMEHPELQTANAVDIRLRAFADELVMYSQSRLTKWFNKLFGGFTKWLWEFDLFKTKG